MEWYEDNTCSLSDQWKDKAKIYDVQNTLSSTPRDIFLRLFKQCLHNSNLTIINKKYGYVEGYILDPSLGMPIHHAWVYNKENNQHYDITVRDGRKAVYIGLKCDSNFVSEVVRSNEYKGSMFETYGRSQIKFNENVFLQ